MKFPWQVLPVTIDGIFLNRMVTGKKYDLPYVGALDEKHLWTVRFNLVTCEPIIDGSNYLYSDEQTSAVRTYLLKHHKCLLNMWSKDKKPIEKLLTNNADDPISVRCDDTVHVLFSDGKNFDIDHAMLNQINDDGYTCGVKTALSKMIDFNTIGAVIADIDGKDYVFLDSEMLVYLKRKICETIAEPKQLTDDMKHFFSYDDIH